MKSDSTIPLTRNALVVLENRYLRRDGQGNVIETPEALFRRVARAVARVEAVYDANADLDALEDLFYGMMAGLEFLPNSPTLMNAGARLGQLSACFVLPVEDSLESIFEAVKNTALIHKSGGGTGFSFSRLRPRNDMVNSTHGVSSGPISFMRVFDMATETIKQGGTRRGANMAVLRVDHPDIEEFIDCKRDRKTTHQFQSVGGGHRRIYGSGGAGDDSFGLINPRDGGEKVRKAARAVRKNRPVGVENRRPRRDLSRRDQSRQSHT